MGAVRTFGSKSTYTVNFTVLTVRHSFPMGFNLSLAPIRNTVNGVRVVYGMIRFTIVDTRTDPTTYGTRFPLSLLVEATMVGSIVMEVGSDFSLIESFISTAADVITYETVTLGSTELFYLYYTNVGSLQCH